MEPIDVSGWTLEEIEDYARGNPDAYVRYWRGAGPIQNAVMDARDRHRGSPVLSCGDSQGGFSGGPVALMLMSGPWSSDGVQPL